MSGASRSEPCQACATIPALPLGRALTAASGLLVLWCLSPLPPALGQPRFASPGSVGLELRLIPQRGTISAGEPLLAELIVTNITPHEVWVLAGNSSAQTTCLRIRNADGRLLAATPCSQSPENMSDTIMSVHRVEPGGEWSRTWVLSAWYPFAHPGSYTIEAQLLGHGSNGGPAPLLAAAVASLNVLPYDGVRLQACCDEIVASDLAVSVKSKALYSVRDDVALPYLDWRARTTGSPYPILAMRRVGTQRAQKLIEQLAARTDRVGDAARHALAMPLEATLWDVMTD